MNKQLKPERLREIRKSLNITMAEASRKLNLSKIGYCRYEYGERTPSTQTVELIAQCFNTSVDYLAGLSNDPKPKKIIIDKEKNEELFVLVEHIQNCDSEQLNRLMKYFKNMNQL